MAFTLRYDIISVILLIFISSISILVYFILIIWISFIFYILLSF